MEIFKDLLRILTRIVKTCIEESTFFVDGNLIKLKRNPLRSDKANLGLKFYIKINREKKCFKKIFFEETLTRK